MISSTLCAANDLGSYLDTVQCYRVIGQYTNGIFFNIDSHLWSDNSMHTVKLAYYKAEVNKFRNSYFQRSFDTAYLACCNLVRRYC